VAGVKRIWDTTPRIHRSAATAFKGAMLEPHDPARLSELLDGCFVHKLTYKLDLDELPRDSMLWQLVTHGAP
jgi:hypothetical protein